MFNQNVCVCVCVCVVPPVMTNTSENVLILTVDDGI